MTIKIRSRRDTARAGRNKQERYSGIGERARLARTGRRPAEQAGWQLPATFSCASPVAEAFGGTPGTATETVALPFLIASF